MQKINFISNFFFKILYRHYKLAILETLEMLTISIEIIVSACSKLSCLPACKNSISSFTFFLRYCREIANVSGHTHQKWHFHSEEAFDNYQQGKINSSFTLSLRYCKDIIKLLFWVLWACLAMHTQSDTINL